MGEASGCKTKTPALFTGRGLPEFKTFILFFHKPDDDLRPVGIFELQKINAGGF